VAFSAGRKPHRSWQPLPETDIVHGAREFSFLLTCAATQKAPRGSQSSRRFCLTIRHSGFSLTNDELYTGYDLSPHSTDSMGLYLVRILPRVLAVPPHVPHVPWIERELGSLPLIPMHSLMERDSLPQPSISNRRIYPNTERGKRDRPFRCRKEPRPLPPDS